MTSQDQIQLLAEKNFLANQLNNISPQAKLTRASLESRLKKIEDSLSRVTTVNTEFAKLTFSGHPVHGSHGISVDFASKATGFFSDAVASVTASLKESLNYMGPIPDRMSSQLMITGTAIGSFGFEFELPKPQSDLFEESTKLEDALSKVRELFQLTAEGADDDVSEIIQEIHPRAVSKVADFLDYLAQQNAWCGLEFKNRIFKFSDIDQLKNSAARIRADNIQQTKAVYSGEFQGVLPAGRNFEFKLFNEQGIIKGKVDIGIQDPDIINREWLHIPINITLDVIKVGLSRPRYTLLTLESIKPLHS